MPKLPNIIFVRKDPEIQRQVQLNVGKFNTYVQLTIGASIVFEEITKQIYSIETRVKGDRIRRKHLWGFGQSIGDMLSPRQQNWLRYIHNDDDLARTSDELLYHLDKTIFPWLDAAVQPAFAYEQMLKWLKLMPVQGGAFYFTFFQCYLLGQRCGFETDPFIIDYLEGAKTRTPDEARMVELLLGQDE